MRKLPFAAALVCALALPIAHAADDATHYVKPNISHADYGKLNVVMPISSADPEVWGTRMQHAYNAVMTAKDWNGQIHLVIVLYGPGIKLLEHKDDDTAKQVAKLREAGIVFKVCNNAMKGMDVDWRTLNNVSETDIVPAGVLEVPYLESKGYSLLPE